MNSGQQHRREREQQRRERAAPVLPMTDERYMELLDAALERRSRANCAYLERHYGCPSYEEIRDSIKRKDEPHDRD